MVGSLEEFKQELTAFQQSCHDNLVRGKKLFGAIDHDEYKDLVHQPLLLKIIFERYLELMESRLIPALENNAKVTAAQQKQPAADVVASQQEQRAPAGMGTPTARVSAGSSDNGPTVDRPPPETSATRQQVAKSAENFRSVESDSTGNHRRAFPRYKRRLPLQYLVLGRDAQAHKAYSRDIGAMGLFIMSNRPEKTGDQVRIDIDVPGAGQTQLDATVVWTKYVPDNLRSVDYSGFGVRISKASETWYNFFVNAKGSN